MARYRRKPPEVDAAKYTGDLAPILALGVEAEDVAGELRLYTSPGSRLDYLLVATGQWVVVSPAGPEVVPDTDFTSRYEPLT